MDPTLGNGRTCGEPGIWLAEDWIPFVPWTVLAVVLVWIGRRFFTRETDLRKKPYRHGRKCIPSSAPPVFPNGWIPLLVSADLRVNEVKPIAAAGQDLVTFRTGDGVAHVMDAYCPHLGAHLGVMGRVVGDCIECPFHGWRFQADTGACAHVPYASKVPAFAKVKTWTCREMYGLIFVWFHADGEQPEWMLEDITELSSGGFREMSRFETTCYGHVQDIAENVADIAHLNCVHQASWLLSADEYARQAATPDSLRSRFMSVFWEASWAPKGFSAYAPFTFDMSLFGWKPRLLRCEGIITQCGPYLAIVHSKTKFGNFLSIMSTTSEGPFRHRIVHRTYAKPGLFSWLACQGMEVGFKNMETLANYDTLLRKLFAALRKMRALSANWDGTHCMSVFLRSCLCKNELERDFIIMANKISLKNRSLVKEDSGLTTFMRWYEQFYSASSPKLQDVRDQSLEW